jgi:hypothetical protein
LKKIVNFSLVCLFSMGLIVFVPSKFVLNYKMHMDNHRYGFFSFFILKHSLHTLNLKIRTSNQVSFEIRVQSPSMSKHIKHEPLFTQKDDV